MKITGITTSVGYADKLARGLALWRDGLDALTVVTRATDRATLALCESTGVPTLCTEAFTRDRAAFNKAAALDDGLLAAAPSDWVLFFDADIVPPSDWRQVVEFAEPVCGSIYGARREFEDGRWIGDGELAGYFQLWHIADPATQGRPLLGSWMNASGYDSTFIERWAEERRIILPLTLTHLGQPCRNWCGIGNVAGMTKLHKDRKRFGGYKHERLDMVTA